ncbi:uncharacterized protein B0I36DRAFT_331202 [Microdochium trichocladiopsis]|uniref:Uncharacterized protein n=1 Tax=Microdochium trichocladiopsis TaxID=1682393 RepID=A0A9P8Y396_9PEZI|nr:uncharacterized protein B0I36DRAFT_331202 [Microdochium trichocladiopsis]KAH7026729.1 hypothetical protein B0I36DRAFT_331202 [Microdochium trichocladiopsis]
MQITAVLLALIPATMAWQYEHGPTNARKAPFGSTNTPCRKSFHPENTMFHWDRDPSEDCCLYLWSNSACSGSAVASTCSDWTKVSVNNFYAYKVQNC